MTQTNLVTLLQQAIPQLQDDNSTHLLELWLNCNAGQPILVDLEIENAGPDYINATEAAAVLSVSRRTITDMFKAGQIPAKKIGREWRTTRDLVYNYLTQP